MRYRAITAIARTDVAKNHECRGAVLPALAYVRTMRLVAHRVEIELAHEVPKARVVRAAGRLDLEPGWLSLGQRFGPVATHDLVECVGHLVLPGDPGPALAEVQAKQSRELMLSAKLSPSRKREPAYANLLTSSWWLRLGWSQEPMAKRAIENPPMSTGAGSPANIAPMQSPVRGVMRTPFRECPVA